MSVFARIAQSLNYKIATLNCNFISYHPLLLSSDRYLFIPRKPNFGYCFPSSPQVALQWRRILTLIRQSLGFFNVNSSWWLFCDLVFPKRQQFPKDSKMNGNFILKPVKVDYLRQKIMIFISTLFCDSSQENTWRVYCNVTFWLGTEEQSLEHFSEVTIWQSLESINETKEIYQILVQNGDYETAEHLRRPGDIIHNLTVVQGY